MRVLLVDNYDSFTQNIAHYLRARGAGVEVLTVRNDEYDRWASGELDAFDACVISPGPGHVAVASDVGISRHLLNHPRRPVLGVCLGHQLIAYAAGAQVVLAPEPMHGRSSVIRHSGKELFSDLPVELTVMRYHSWIVDAALPNCLVATAWTADGQIMALRHRALPQWGVQFHPESIGTPFGKRLLHNFLDQVAHRVKAHRMAAATSVRVSGAGESGMGESGMGVPGARPGGRRSLYWRRLEDGCLDPVRLVEAARANTVYPNGVSLLESSLARQGLARFTYIGVPVAPDDSEVTYSSTTQTLTETVPKRGIGQRCQPRRGSILEWLDERLCDIDYPDGEPDFDFHGGHVGWLGYELLRETVGVVPSSVAAEPDAAFRTVNVFLVIDHEKQCLYAAVNLPSAEGDGNGSVERYMRALQSIAERARAGEALANPIDAATEPVVFRRRHSDRAYLDRIEACRSLIRAGESYELCLTNQLVTDHKLDSWTLYKVLRRRNSSTYAAYLSIAGVDVVCASPELFMAVDGEGGVRAKPIKGTVRRGDTPLEDRQLAAWLSASEKERAENLMITDLLRHDISGVSIPGTVQVPHLMAIETYPAVHQLVSTITGRLRPGRTIVDLIRSAFPGGSMTGAPKVRSIALLDALEQGARGVYSGSLGWISHDGRAMLNIVIRSAIVSASGTTVGCGGAVTYLSDPQEELEEVHLKSRAILRAIAETATGDPDNYRVQDEAEKALINVDGTGEWQLGSVASSQLSS